MRWEGVTNGYAGVAAEAALWVHVVCWLCLFAGTASRERLASRF